MPDDIIFEDLHGIQEDSEELEVDLSNKDGIARAPFDDEPSDEGDTGDDDTRDAADDDESAGDEGEKPDETKPKGKNKFEARLDRERRAKKAAQAEAARYKADLQKLRKSQRDSAKQLSQAEIDRLDGEIAAKRRELAKAIEDGDTEQQIELNVALAEAIASKKAAQVTAPGDDDDDVIDEEPDDLTGRKQTLVQNWTDSHSEWFGKPGYEKETRMARRIDAEVFREGYEPHEDEYFEELDRRIREKAPHLFDSDESEDNEDDAGESAEDTDTKEPPKKGKRSAVAGVSSDRDKQTVRQGKDRVLITADDKRVMRNFGLDPNNAEHVKEFALNKRQADRGVS